jgi:hypothetical protein
MVRRPKQNSGANGLELPFVTLLAGADDASPRLTALASAWSDQVIASRAYLATRARYARISSTS